MLRCCALCDVVHADESIRFDVIKILGSQYHQEHLLNAIKKARRQLTIHREDEECSNGIDNDNDNDTNNNSNKTCEPGPTHRVSILWAVFL